MDYVEWYNRDMFFYNSCINGLLTLDPDSSLQHISIVCEYCL